MKRVIRATAEEKPLVERVQDLLDRRVSKFTKLEEGNFYLERHSIQSLIDNNIRYFNQNVREEGDGFASDWDPDDWMSILYKDGTIREVNPECDDGTRRIKTDGIESIILDGSWGTACAGPNLEAVDYTVYEDIPDIRIEFQ